MVVLRNVRKAMVVRRILGTGGGWIESRGLLGRDGVLVGAIGGGFGVAVKSNCFAW